MCKSVIFSRFFWNVIMKNKKKLKSVVIHNEAKAVENNTKDICLPVSACLNEIGKNNLQLKYWRSTEAPNTPTKRACWPTSTFGRWQKISLPGNGGSSGRASFLSLWSWLWECFHRWLVQVLANGTCDWCTYGFVVSTLHGRLLPDRARKLVYVHYNLCAVNRVLAADYDSWREVLWVGRQWSKSVTLTSEDTLFFNLCESSFSFSFNG